MFIVESGVVTCHMDFLRLHHRMQLPTVSQDILAVAPVRQFDYGPGGIVGELDFFLQQQRSFEAVCKESCTLLCISRYLCCCALHSLPLPGPRLLVLACCFVVLQCSIGKCACTYRADTRSNM